MSSTATESSPRARGHYLGTEIDACWWRRYRKDGLFARGNGEYWIAGDALYFRRYLTREPLVIDLRHVSALKIGRWHAGRWAGGAPVFKFLWTRDGLPLSSGFVLGTDAGEIQRLTTLFEQRIGDGREHNP